MMYLHDQVVRERMDTTSIKTFGVVQDRHGYWSTIARGVRNQIHPGGEVVVRYNLKTRRWPSRRIADAVDQNYDFVASL